MYLGKTASGKHTNKCTKSAEKSNRETRNDSIARKCWEMSAYQTKILSILHHICSAWFLYALVQYSNILLLWGFFFVIVRSLRKFYFFFYSIFWQQGTRCCCIDIIRCQTGERGIYNITMNNNTTIQEDLKIHQYNLLFLIYTY